ncbi:DUF3489 domain-containing protein [Oceanomicrobium pacificus]|uniref:DUF3489 domain-containing protein n=1 Tax=Oceanomicrobium pacificus TaxID=2692916 RepID=A0A6B0U038_9RHOB|nr:DUF3489 domain-containing protein [Oceanomicrobium pacificus]
MAICKATGWQRHSAHAFLSGLRNAGYVLERRADPATGKDAVYCITAEPEAVE